MSSQADQESKANESKANDQLEDVDEQPVESTSSEDEGNEDSKEDFGGDDRVPLPAPDLQREISDGHVQLEKQFRFILQSLEETEQLKFSAYISDPSNKDVYGFRFRLETSKLGAGKCAWESIRSLTELYRLAEGLQKDKHIRGMGYSVPPLPEKKKSKAKNYVPSLLTSDQRGLVVQFVRQMFTNFIFLGHSMVLSAFNVPGAVRTKIDTLAKLHQTPLISSLLNKQGWNVKSWRKRWVVLYPDFCLRYYEGEKQGVGTGFRGMVDIQAMYQVNYESSEKSESQHFSLSLKSEWEETQRAREYRFETPDIELRDTWIKAVSMLRDGKISEYIPEFCIVDAPSMEDSYGISGLMRTSFMKGRVRRPSEMILDKENQSNVKLLTKLSELREQQESFEENQKKEKEEYERERQKIEDEWSDLKVSYEAAKKTLQREQDSLKTIEQEYRECEKKWEGKLEKVEKQVQNERLRFNLRSTNSALDVVASSPRKIRKRLTVIENTAPSVYAGVLGMLTGESEKRNRDVWYLKISKAPFMEWADVSDQLNPGSATRMQIAEVFPGKREFKGRAFVVRSAKKDKQITFITSKPSECQKWIRTIKNGLGLLSDSDNEYKYEAETKVEIDAGYVKYKDDVKTQEGKEESTLHTVSKEVDNALMKFTGDKLEVKGTVAETGG